jgi:hypothetical protein
MGAANVAGMTMLIHSIDRPELRSRIPMISVRTAFWVKQTRGKEVTGIEKKGREVSRSQHTELSGNT